MNKSLLPFAKYSGNGNDFVILDHPTAPITAELVRRLCDRHFGVGADGVLTLTSALGLDGEMRIFNADGGEAEMCGNGLRCLATYLDDVAKHKQDSYRIKTMNHEYTVLKREGAMAIEMSAIKDQNRYDLSAFTDFENSFFVNTGVPHLAFLSKDAKSIDIKQVAPFYRHHSLFPGGTNVSFIEVLDAKAQTAYVRTYERGVEDETHSCGTGLTASALALSHWLGWQGKIQLQTKGGRQQVELGDKVLYSGEVFCCFRGEIAL